MGKCIRDLPIEVVVKILRYSKPVTLNRLALSVLPDNVHAALNIVFYRTVVLNYDSYQPPALSPTEMTITVGLRDVDKIVPRRKRLCVQHVYITCSNDDHGSEHFPHHTKKRKVSSSVKLQIQQFLNSCSSISQLSITCPHIQLAYHNPHETVRALKLSSHTCIQNLAKTYKSNWNSVEKLSIDFEYQKNREIDFSVLDTQCLKELNITMQQEKLNGHMFQLPNLKKLAVINSLQHTIDSFDKRYLKSVESLQIHSSEGVIVRSQLDLPSLRHLLFASSLTGKLDNFGNLPSLQVAKLLENGFKDLTSDVQCWTQLRELDMSVNRLFIIKNLDGLTNLRRLNLSRNLINSISGLQDLVHLTFLDLSGNKIKFVENLELLTQLQELRLANNPIKSISQDLKSLGNLRLLDLSNTDLRVIHSIASLTSLVWLDLLGTKITDLSVIQKLKNLKNVAIRGTPIFTIDTGKLRIEI